MHDRIEWIISRFKTHVIIFFLFSIVLFSAFGFFLGRHVERQDELTNAPTPIADTAASNGVSTTPHTTYTLTNPLLECGDIDNVSNKWITTAKSAVKTYIQKQNDDGKPDEIAVYFRDLNNGPWFSINSDLEFIPGSLLKVPFMISLFKETELHPDFLSRTMLYEGGRSDVEQFFKPREFIVPGTVYTISDLIRRMITFSDNDSTVLLTNTISSDKIQSSYSDLGISSPMNNQYTLSVRTYASFFRILFNATYINRDLSEQALTLLTQTDFKEGLVAFLPQSIRVAHKFGEREITGQNQKQLHDCGIIYYPNRPYILCVMSRSTYANYHEPARIIADISKMVFDLVDADAKAKK